MNEPRRTCRDCSDSVDPDDPGVVLAMRLVESGGFNPNGSRERTPSYAYFHREHLHPGYTVLSTPPTWD